MASYALVAVGLNIVIGYAGLLDLGYVGFYATGRLHDRRADLAALALAVLPRAADRDRRHHDHRRDPRAHRRCGCAATTSPSSRSASARSSGSSILNTSWLGASAGIKDIPSPPSIGPDAVGTDQDGLFQIPHLAWHGLTPLIDNEHKTPFLVFGVLDAIPYYWLLLTVLLIVLVADFLIKESRVGRAWEATREDEDAAELMGVPTFRYKLLAFALGAAIGGLAGSMLAAGQGGYINPNSFLILLSMLFVAAVIIGGAGNRWGAIVGGALVAYLPERFRALSDWRLLIFGLALMLIVNFRPQGLLPPRRTRRAHAGQGRDRGARRGGRRCLTTGSLDSARRCSRSTTSPSGSVASPRSTR